MEHKQGQIGDCKSYACMNSKTNGDKDYWEQWSKEYDGVLRATQWGKIYFK